VLHSDRVTLCRWVTGITTATGSSGTALSSSSGASSSSMVVSGEVEMPATGSRGISSKVTSSRGILNRGECPLVMFYVVLY